MVCPQLEISFLQDVPEMLYGGEEFPVKRLPGPLYLLLECAADMGV